MWQKLWQNLLIVVATFYFSVHSFGAEIDKGTQSYDAKVWVRHQHRWIQARVLGVDESGKIRTRFGSFDQEKVGSCANEQLGFACKDKVVYKGCLWEITGFLPDGHVLLINRYFHLRRTTFSKIAPYNEPFRDIDTDGTELPRIGEVVLIPGKFWQDDKLAVVQNITPKNKIMLWGFKEKFKISKLKLLYRDSKSIKWGPVEGVSLNLGDQIHYASYCRQKIPIEIMGFTSEGVPVANVRYGYDYEQIYVTATLSGEPYYGSLSLMITSGNYRGFQVGDKVQTSVSDHVYTVKGFSLDGRVFFGHSEHLSVSKIEHAADWQRH